MSDFMIRFYDDQSNCVDHIKAANIASGRIDEYADRYMDMLSEAMKFEVIPDDE